MQHYIYDWVGGRNRPVEGGGSIQIMIATLRPGRYLHDRLQPASASRNLRLRLKVQGLGFQTTRNRNVVQTEITPGEEQLLQNVAVWEQVSFVSLPGFQV